jgi:hypothetical protein
MKENKGFKLHVAQACYLEFNLKVKFNAWEYESPNLQVLCSSAVGS